MKRLVTSLIIAALLLGMAAMPCSAMVGPEQGGVRPAAKGKNVDEGQLDTVVVAPEEPLFGPYTGEGAKNVRVGYYLLDGYQEITDDGLYGYNYEYLMQISRHTGWTYEFVYEDYETCLAMLGQGKLELMGGLTAGTSTRLFARPIHKAGESYTALFTRNESRHAAGDFAAWDGITVAFVQGAATAVELAKYAADNGFSATPVAFETVGEVVRAVENGDVEAGALERYRGSNTTRLLGTFTPESFYFMTTGGNTEIIAGLERAMGALAFEYPDYHTELERRYLPIARGEFQMTASEREYIERGEIFSVSVGNLGMPMSIQDDNGKITGALADMFEDIHIYTGLKFRYTLDDEQSDIIAAYGGDFDDAIFEGYALTDIYAQVPMALVSGQGVGKTVAVVNGFCDYTAIEGFSDAAFVYYASAADCISAVASSRVNCAIVDWYSANCAVGAYKGLTCVIMLGASARLRIAVTQQADPALVTLLNKVIAARDPREFGDDLVKNSVITVRKTEISEYVERIPTVAYTGAALILLILVFILFAALRARGKKLKKLKSNLENDALTGLLSRRGFEKKAGTMLRKKRDKNLFVVDFDINKFDSYNTVYGLEAGNELLRSIAQLTENQCSETELAARLDADHFAALLEGEGPDVEKRLSGLNAMLERITKGLGVLLSFGIYKVDDTSLSIAEMLDHAFAAKRLVKGSYERTVGVFDEGLHARQKADAELISQLETAISDGDMRVFYQPKYSLKTEKLAGAEALVRWQKDEDTLVMPETFIELLERNNLTPELDLFVFEKVCTTVAAIYKATRKITPVSINISRGRVFDAGFIVKLGNIVRAHRLPMDAIEIEIPETAFVEHGEGSADLIQLMHDEGFSVAIDDFGKSYSSLNTLKNARCDTVKLDRAFYVPALDDTRAAAVLKNALSLAQTLKLTVIGEGVETAEHAELLKKNGCELCQGVLYSEPVTTREFGALVGVDLPEEIIVKKPRIVEPEPIEDTAKDPVEEKPELTKKELRKLEKQKKKQDVQPEPTAETAEEPVDEKPSLSKKELRKLEKQKKKQDVQPEPEATTVEPEPAEQKSESVAEPIAVDKPKADEPPAPPSKKQRKWLEKLKKDGEPDNADKPAESELEIKKKTEKEKE